MQEPRLQMEQARARGDEKNHPANPATHLQLAVKELRSAEPEQRRREEVGSRADQEIADACENRA